MAETVEDFNNYGVMIQDHVGVVMDIIVLLVAVEHAEKSQQSLIVVKHADVVVQPQLVKLLMDLN
jgi:hypothetical protein